MKNAEKKECLIIKITDPDDKTSVTEIEGDLEVMQVNTHLQNSKRFVFSIVILILFNYMKYIRLAQTDTQAIYSVASIGSE